jgi:hypothetical protein
MSIPFQEIEYVDGESDPGQFISATQNLEVLVINMNEAAHP